MSKNTLHDLYNKYIKELELVVTKQAKPDQKLEKFYLLLYRKDWEYNDDLASKLLKFYNKYSDTILRSLAQIGATRLRSESSEYKMQNSKEYLKRLNRNITDETELSLETDAFYPEMSIQDIRNQLKTEVEPDAKIKFKRASRNVNPTAKNAREFVTGSGNIITNNYSERRLEMIPSGARNTRKAINLMADNYEYWNQFMSKNKGVNLYDPKQGKKFYSLPNTWMFDIMYFSNYGSKKIKNPKLKYEQAIYLVGININTRYAVGRRINGKTVADMINAFKDLLNRELKDKINLLIFDGEKAISSKAFEQFCIENSINVRITYPGIHTQTAPIDRLCRTLRDYYTKMFLTKVSKAFSDFNVNYKFNEYFRKNFVPLPEETKFRNKLLTETIYARQMFNGEHSQILAPIPIQYTSLMDFNGDISFIKNHISRDTWNKYYKNDYYEYELRDELYDVIDYYNNKPHHGLIKLLKEASSLFSIQLKLIDEYDDPVKIEEVTPKYIHENKSLEYLIIEYCKYYNNHFVEEVTYRIGDKVKVYNCFSSERGSLYRNPNDFLMGDWEIIDKDGEIYCVYNNVDNRRLWVSKYMLRSKNATSKATSSWREKLLEAQKLMDESSDD